MIALYVGIYRIALGLHRRSVAQRERSIACLVSMAGGTVTQIGSAIGMTRTADGLGPPQPADAPVAAAVDQRHDDDDDEDDDDYRQSADTPHFASRLPTLLLPATSFALFGRLGAARRHNSHTHAGCQRKTVKTTTSLRASSPEVRPHAVDDTAAPGFTIIKHEGSRSKSLSTAATYLEKSDRAANLDDKQPSAAARWQKRDAASAVAARPEDLHDLPYFDDDDVDDRRRQETPTTADDGGKIEIGGAQMSATVSSSPVNEERVVRFVAATGDVAITECDATPTHREDVVLLKSSCNGGRRLAAQSSASTSSRLQQQRNRYTSGFASHVWRHVVVHKEGRHAESRLEKAAEPDERQALLRASCPRHGG